MIKEEILKTATDSVLDKLLFKRQIGESVTVTPDEYCAMFKEATVETRGYQTVSEKMLDAQTDTVIRATDDIEQILDKAEMHIESTSANLKLIDMAHKNLQLLGSMSNADEDTLNLIKNTIITLTAQLAASQKEVAHARARVHELEMEVTTDHLTKAMNRAAMDRKLATLEESKTSFAVINCDLNFFKVVNDTFGHDAGDEVLQVFTQRIQTHLKNSDQLYRMGGDEFAVLLEGVTDPVQVKKVIGRLKAAISDEPVMLSGKEVPLSSSMGGGICCWDTATAKESAFKTADTNLYKDKESPERAAVRLAFEKLSTLLTGTTAKGFRV